MLVASFARASSAAAGCDQSTLTLIPKGEQGHQSQADKADANLVPR
jgi:hypothetical protein